MIIGLEIQIIYSDSYILILREVIEDNDKEVIIFV